MSGLPFGLVVESAVAVLLALTLGYCVVLNSRLKRLHADRDMLRKMIGDLVTATDLANGAIKGLKETAVETEAAIGARLEAAERFGVELANHVNAGQAVMERLARITTAARGGNGGEAGAEPQPVGKAQAALQQLSLNGRISGTAA